MQYSMVHLSVELPDPEQFESMSDQDKAHALGGVSNAGDSFLSTLPALVASTGRAEGEIVSHGLAVHGQSAILSFLIRSE